LESIRPFNGIVPEIVARDHHEKLTPLLDETLKQAQVKLSDLDLIGVTTHPGLMGPLITGVNFAKTLSLILQIPIVPINHLFAHIEAIQIDHQISYPYHFCLVSGGHTLFGHALETGNYQVKAGTLDDAAGEAFDKGGNMIGLGYPAGFIIDKLSQWGRLGSSQFSVGLAREKNNPNTSFSGLKNALRLELEKLSINLDPKLEASHYYQQFNPKFQTLYNLCADFQLAIVKSLTTKFKVYLNEQKTVASDAPIVLCGGVACNSLLRSEFKRLFKHLYLVSPEFCTDNGAMIANLALLSRQEAKQFPESLSLDALSTKDWNK
jgi:N6-L-threonylcarbamoyladenine synthase